jgi:C-terminal processing protease CtpA/Prc
LNGGLQTADALKNFDYFWSVFDEHYAFFAERGIDWEQAKSEYRDQVTTENLWEILTAMVAPLEDDHVTITHSDGTVFKAGQQKLYGRFYHEYVEAGEPGDFETYVQSEYGKLLENIQLNYLNGELKTAANDRIFWGKLPDNIGYLHILEMSNYTDSFDPAEHLNALQFAMDDVIDDLKACDKIVIDVRFNSGGLDLASLEIGGRFTTQTKIVWNIQARDNGSFTSEQAVELNPTGELQIRKDILVLTSAFTASAAETFVLAMMEVDNVQTMGENTNGIFSTMLDKRLPNGWQFTLSNERWTSLEGSSFEVTGITPDFLVPFPSAEERNNGVDLVLGEAMQFFE